MTCAYFAYAHRPTSDRQTLVYGVWMNDGAHRLAWLDLDRRWLRNEASLNDLKDMAIEQVRSKDPEQTYQGKASNFPTATDIGTEHDQSHR